MGDTHAAVEAPERGVPRLERERLLEQRDGAGRILGEELLVALVEQPSRFGFVEGTRPFGTRGGDRLSRRRLGRRCLLRRRLASFGERPRIGALWICRQRELRF